MDSHSCCGISIRDLTLMRAGKLLYRNFSLEIQPASVTVLIAPSGRGKTTLLDYLGGILSVSGTTVSGRCRFTGAAAEHGTPGISYLFQEPRLIPGIPVLENILIPLVNTMSYEDSHARAVYFAGRVGLSDRLSVFPLQLSGGEKQRTAIARAFAFPSDILLMDEAFQSQDIGIKVNLMELFESMITENPRTVLFVTHDVKEAVCLADRILVLDGSPLQVLLDERNDKGPESVRNRLFFDPFPPAAELEKRIIRLLIS
ncbi:MAG: ATP-binding cassette domain-containing protein [Treponema sp.]|jgi:NitT/TauT family transport system ATP-binding protein|nr:ATP-binding cassette domain-containing protein [Treponema sp.]